jgi:hypothetical protein
VLFDSVMVAYIVGVGYYVPSARSVIYYVCPANSISSLAGQSSCSTCAAGYYALAGATACTSCPIGMFRSSGMSACAPCPVNTFAALSGSTACLPCAPQYYSFAGSSLCMFFPLYVQPEPTYLPSSMPTSQPSRQPSRQPTLQPSSQPTERPSSQPTCQPSLQPTTQPTRQPTFQPTAQPTRRPSRQPTSQPSVHPSAQPSQQPTAQPSVQPSRIPSAQPSSRPSSRPTSQPSARPTRHPTAQPSARPLVQPSVQPTTQPSSRPTRQPTSQPTRQPSCRPSCQPTTQPSQQPFNKPSTQPTGEPSRIPSVQPTTQPSKRPTGQPSDQPTRQPSAQPTGRPTVQPSGIPSSRPSIRPSRQPTSQPSRKPTAIPSRLPSAQPSGSPSQQPTRQPSAQPTGRPSRLPTTQPTCQPSRSPTAQPSARPTDQPTLQPTTQPSRQPTEQPSSQPSSQPSTKPSRQPTAAPTRRPSTQPTTQPSLRPTGQPTEQPSQQPTLQPSSRPTSQPSAQPSRQPTSRPSVQPTSQPTEQPSVQPTVSPSRQPSAQPTLQPTRQPSGQPTMVPTSQPSRFPTVQPSGQPTEQPSLQPTAQPSRQPTTRPTAQPSNQPSSQPTRLPTSQPTVQPSRQPSTQPTERPTAQPTEHPTQQPTGQPTTQPTKQPTKQPSSQPSVQPSARPSRQPTSHPTSQPSVQPTDRPSSQPSSLPTSQPTIIPSSQPSRQPSAQPSMQPSAHPSSQPSRQPTSRPSTQPSEQPSSQPTLQPTLFPTSQPSVQPTAQPTRQPSRQPTAQPTTVPTRQPTSQPTVNPSSQPSGQPSRQPTAQPTVQPSVHPTAQPSCQPTRQPSSQPSRQPSGQPSIQPTVQPSSQPSSYPTSQPTVQPTSQPSAQPSRQPSHQPSAQPSVQPSSQPSIQPTAQPTSQPTSQPTLQPTTQPTTQPSVQPTRQPTGQPTTMPTLQPSSQPTQQPSRQPTTQPTMQPTVQPSQQPSAQPSRQPTRQPTGQPSRQPTSQPTRQPSRQPTRQPTSHPSVQPSSTPTTQPTVLPSAQPTSIPSSEPSSQPTSQPTKQPTRQPSSQPTRQPTTQPTRQPTSQPSRQPTTQPSAVPSAQPTKKPTVQPTGRPSSLPSTQPTAQPTRFPTALPSGQPSGEPTCQPTGQPSPQPTRQPTTQPTRQPTRQPTGQPSRQPTSQPTRQPTVRPTLQPSSHPTEAPSTQPSAQPSGQPTVFPTCSPSSQPSFQPTVHPSYAPSAQPSPQPTTQPSKFPSAQPSARPTQRPSTQPTGHPTAQPTGQPIPKPSSQPSSQPTLRPSTKPTSTPSNHPSGQPTSRPTNCPSAQPSAVPLTRPSGKPSSRPSRQPSSRPTSQPTGLPTKLPTTGPSAQPVARPTGMPSCQPSRQPSSWPTSQPTSIPSNRPTLRPVTSAPTHLGDTNPPTSRPTTALPSSVPSRQPSTRPSVQPTGQPSRQPVSRPSARPSHRPTVIPSRKPTGQPSLQPVVHPTSQPSVAPSAQPSILPSIKPTSQPSTQPTNVPTWRPTTHPTAVPSCRPTGQPTSMPISRPTSVPTVRPSTKPSSVPTYRPLPHPTRIPSSWPSRKPVSTPSREPTTIPSCQPTGMPSGRPSVRPSSRPSQKPTVYPSSGPSSDPTIRPSEGPSSRPTVRPSAQPSRIPTAQPSRQPSRQPTAQPSGRPSSQPSRRPSAQPSQRPSSRPSVLPSMVPSAHPSIMPTTAPSVRPTRHPTSTPTIYPISRPSAIPSYRPTRLPVIPPSSRPTILPVSSHPSSHPSRMPSSRPRGDPTCGPSSLPSRRPATKQPSSCPSGRPSTTPSSSSPTSHPTTSSPLAKGTSRTTRPTAVPTSSPTASLRSLWKEAYQNYSAVTSTNPDVVSYSSLVFGGEVIEGLCPAWSSKLFLTAATKFIMQTPKSVTMTLIDTLTSYADWNTSSYRCSNVDSVANIVKIMTGFVSLGSSSRTVYCPESDSNWTFSSCGISSLRLGGMCVNCFDPCNTQNALSCADTISPCSSTLSGCSKPMIQDIRIDFIPKQAAPTLLRVQTVASRSAVNLNIWLSGPGSVYCLPVETARGTPPSSIVEVEMSEFQASTLSHNVTIEIVSLTAITVYDVYCLTASPDGSKLSYTQLLDSKTTVQTLCCKALTVSLSRSFVYTSTSYNSYVSVRLDAAPSLNLIARVSFTSLSGGDVHSCVYPAVSTFQSAATSLVGSMSLLPELSAGNYNVSMFLSGASASEYKIFIDGTGMLLVLPAGTPPPGPAITSASFSGDGSVLTVTFDVPTDRAKLSTIFTCSALFEFAKAVTTKCQWMNALSVQAFVTGDGGIIPGGQIALRARNKLYALGINATTMAVAVNVTTVLPSSLVIVVPTVSISAPSSISFCDSLLLDFSGSRGSGGRSWETVNITVFSGKASTAAVQLFLDALYVTSTVPKPIPSSLLTGGAAYRFTVILCNFLGRCGQKQASVFVLASNLPSVTISGSLSRSLYKSNSLLVSSKAYIPSCNATRSSMGLSYVWTASDVSLVSTSKDPAAYLLPAYSLQVNSLYTLTVAVTITYSGLTSTQSVIIKVQVGPLVVQVSGGSLQSVRQGGSLSLDASGSYDSDIYKATGTAAGLLFNWSCEQQLPFPSGNCSVVLTSARSPVAGITTTDTSANSTSTISLVVGDAVLLRAVRAAVDIRVVDSSCPTVAIKTAFPGKINPDKSFVLSGLVVATSSAALVGTVRWTVDADGIDLPAVALLPTSTTMSSTSTTTAVTLLLRPGALPAFSTLVFSLSVLLSSGLATTASILVLVNGPPVPGQFHVTPSIGTALTDTFIYSASLWTDEDFPLTYQFGLLSAASNLTFVLQTLSESSFGSSILSAGQSTGSDGYTDHQVLVAEIFDSYLAVSAANLDVRVTATSMSLSEAASLISASFMNEGSVDGIKRKLTITVSTLNSVNCSLSPNCTALHRGLCSSTPNTCGQCMDGYIGVTGSSNSLCLSTTEAVGAVALDYVGTFCNSSNNVIACPSGYFCLNHTCHVYQQACSTNCAQHGVCEYVDVHSGVLLESCSAYDIGCVAECTCIDSWSGLDCTVAEEDALLVMSVNEELSGNLAYVVDTENPSTSAVTNWINGLSGVSSNYQFLTNSSVNMLQSTASRAIATAADISLSIDAAVAIVDTVDNVASVVNFWSSERRRGRRRLSDAGIDRLTILNQTASLLGQIGSYVSGALVAGQESVPVVTTQFRMRMVTLTGSAVSGSSLSLPVDTMESLTAVHQTSVHFSGSSADASGSVGMTAVSLSSRLYDNPSFQSNPLMFQVSSGVCITSDPCSVVIVLQNNVEVDYSAPSVTQFQTRCGYDDYSLHTYFCPLTGDIVTATCNGSSIIINTKCPFSRPTADCGVLNGLEAVFGSCQVLSFTSTNTSCSCILNGMNAVERRLASSNSSSSTISVNLVSMTTYLGVGMEQTILSAADLNLKSLIKSWAVFLTIGTFLGIFLFLGYVAHRADIRDKTVKPAESILEKAAWSIQKRRRPGDTSKYEKPKRKYIEDYTEIQAIEKVLPNVLRSKSLSVKFTHETKRFHRWFGIVFHFSPVFPRILRLTSIFSTIVIQLFLQAITYKLSNPDDGTCEILTNSATCLAPRSPLSSSEAKCYWTDGYERGQCHFREPGNSIEIVLFIAVFSALVSTPLAILSEWVVHGTLAAKTKAFQSSSVTWESGDRFIVPVTRRQATTEAARLPAEAILVSSVSDELMSLTRGLKSYRSTLTDSQRTEFDSLWGLTVNGEFVTNTNQLSRHTGWRRYLKFRGKQLNTTDLVSADLAAVRNSIQVEFGLLQSSTRSMSDKSDRLMYLFQRDLMPAMNGQILDAKNKRDQARPEDVSASKKLLGWCYVIMTNLCMLFYILLFAIQTTSQRQSAWLKSFCIWLFMDIFLISTVVVVVTHIAIPMLTMKDIEKIKEKMISTIQAHLKATKNVISGADSESKEAEEGRRDEEFNAAEYMFASYRLAKLLPNIRTSDIITKYRTVWPKQSYLHQTDVKSLYSGRFSSINKTISMVLVSLISNSVSLPPAIQDIIAHVTSTAAIGYTVLLHMQLFKVYPVLVVVPTVIIGIIAHLFMRGFTSRSRAELAKLLPAAAKEERASRADKYRSSPETTSYNHAGADRHVVAETVTRDGQTFMTRRQSVVAGKVLLNSMLRQKGDVLQREDVDEAAADMIGGDCDFIDEKVYRLGNNREERKNASCSEDDTDGDDEVDEACDYYGSRHDSVLQVNFRYPNHNVGGNAEDDWCSDDSDEMDGGKEDECRVPIRVPIVRTSGALVGIKRGVSGGSLKPRRLLHSKEMTSVQAAQTRGSSRSEGIHSDEDNEAGEESYDNPKRGGLWKDRLSSHAERLNMKLPTRRDSINSGFVNESFALPDNSSVESSFGSFKGLGNNASIVAEDDSSLTSEVGRLRLQWKNSVSMRMEQAATVFIPEVKSSPREDVNIGTECPPDVPALAAVDTEGAEHAVEFDDECGDVTYQSTEFHDRMTSFRERLQERLTSAKLHSAKSRR